LFYLLHNDLELATYAFQKCQFHNLDFPLGWLGQAFTAEILGDEHASELFEHSYNLGNVANHEILYQFAKQRYLHPKNGDGLSDASFALLKCFEKNSSDPHTLNLLGLLLERQRRIEKAIEVLQTALALAHADRALFCAISTNLSRCYCANGEYEKSVDCFKAVLSDQPDPYALACFGNALYFAGHSQESLEVFQLALDRSASDTKSVSTTNDVTVLLCQVLYGIGSPT
ncbi:Tetratricopeptide repeat protein 37, partial [Kappamyces sp. JEL0680]